MAKLILLAVIFLIAYSLVKKPRSAPVASRREEDMVRCAHCGVFQPKSESVAAGGEYFCSAEHLGLHRE